MYYAQKYTQHTMLGRTDTGEFRLSFFDEETHTKVGIYIEN
jgi:hypothetical protein